MNTPISDDERKELYLTGGGVNCPFCGSDNLYGLAILRCRAEREL